MYLKKSPFSVACCMILPLETLPTPEIRVGKRFTSGFFCLQTKHLALWVFLNMGFHGEALLAPRPTPKLEDHPLSAVRDCLFNLFAATLHTRGRSSIRNLRTSHAVVTGTHLSWIHVCVCVCIYIYIYIYTYELRIQIKSNNIERYWVMLHVKIFWYLLLKLLHWTKISIGIPNTTFLQRLKWIYKKETF